jgi:hypothetical protein
VLGDFNLHHPLWRGPWNPSTHAAADRLVTVMLKQDITLVSPRGAVTWEAQGHTSTIDLVFMLPLLQQQIVRCKVREDLNFGSDHYPIAMRLLLNTTRLKSVLRCRWKGMDIDAIRARAQHLAIPESLRTADRIDRYTQYIIEFTQGFIEHTVPWAKPSSHGQPWWTEDIRITVREERTARKQWRISGNAADWNDKIRAGRAKVRMIREAKCKCFREMVHEAAQGEGIWKLAK